MKTMSVSTQVLECGSVGFAGFEYHKINRKGLSFQLNYRYFLIFLFSFFFTESGMAEPIEEHTLVTNDCIIANGSAHGGSSAGAELLDEEKMTLWTDPNYGAVKGTASGLYWDYPGTTSADGVFLAQKNIGSLQFASTGLDLTIGSSVAYIPANFYTMPVCNIAKTGSAGTINIEDGSTWDYYGSSVRSNWNSGLLTVNLNGPSGAPTAPNLNIHAGAVFWECSSLSADHAMIDILFDNNINPINTAANTGDRLSGLLRVSNSTVFSDSKVNSFEPCRGNVVMKITGTGSGATSTDVTFVSISTDYTNDGGNAIVQFNELSNSGASPDKCTFNGGTATQMTFHCIDPQLADLKITNMTFHGWIDKAIWIERTNSLTNNYGNIEVSNNTFEVADYRNLLGCDPLGPNPSNQFGIFLKNFNLSGLEGKVLVTNNLFTDGTDAANNLHGTLQAAVQLTNTTGNITNNHITDCGFRNGINIGNTSVTIITKPYLCNDRVENLDGGGTGLGSGIQTEGGYQGFIKSCQILGCGFGVNILGQLDVPGIVFTRIQNCIGIGLAVEILCHVKLSGVHGISSGGDDYAAFDTISENGSSSLSNSTQIALFADGTNRAKLDLGNSLQLFTWQHFAENNIIQVSGNNNLITSDNTNGAGINALGNIDNNFWGASGISPANFFTTPGDGHRDGTSNIFATGVSYDGNTAVSRTSETAAGFSVSCGGGFSTPNKENLPQSVLSLDSCKLLYNLANAYDENNMYRECYDTARKFIETCPNYQGSYEGFQFTDVGIANSNLNDTARYRQYREWLISVLFLNTTDPTYFCTCIASIAGTYQYSEHKRFPNALNTIYRWMLTHHYCPNFSWHKYDSLTMIENHAEWIGSGDSAKGKPFDTTMNTMAELGLGFLDSLTFGVNPSKTPSSTYLSDLNISPNPSHGLVTAKYSLSRQGFIQFTVFDALGRVVWSRAGESEFEGTHELPIDLRSTPSGTYYVRIEAGFGEVKTVKIINEK